MRKWRLANNSVVEFEEVGQWEGFAVVREPNGTYGLIDKTESENIPYGRFFLSRGMTKEEVVRRGYLKEQEGK